MNVINRLRRIPTVGQLRDLALHRLPRYIADGLIPKAGQQMLTDDMPMVLLR